VTGAFGESVEIEARCGRGPIGGRFHFSTGTVTANIPHGKVVGATPDGRKAFAPVNEGISPYRGTDCDGPTASLKSVSKIPTEVSTIGNLLNVKFNPLYLGGSLGTKGLGDLIKTFFMLGGYHIQLNVIDRQTLLDAKSHPERHRDLVVRVSGYSALFTQLDPVVQDDLIQRTEFGK